MRDTTSQEIPLRCRSVKAGFTLLELLIASALLGMVITGVMALLGIGRGMESESILRSQALVLAAARLENPANQNPIAGGSIPPVDQVIPVNLKTSAGVNVPGQSTLVVSSIVNDAWPEIGGGTIIVPYQMLNVTVQWGFAGVTDLVVLRKRVSAIK